MFATLGRRTSKNTAHSGRNVRDETPSSYAYDAIGNRPIRWQSGDTVITMAVSRMGRRVEMRIVKDDEETVLNKDVSAEQKR